MRVVPRRRSAAMPCSQTLHDRARDRGEATLRRLTRHRAPAPWQQSDRAEDGKAPRQGRGLIAVPAAVDLPTDNRSAMSGWPWQGVRRQQLSLRLSCRRGDRARATAGHRRARLRTGDNDPDRNRRSDRRPARAEFRAIGQPQTPCAWIERVVATLRRQRQQVAGARAT